MHSCRRLFLHLFGCLLCLLLLACAGQAKPHAAKTQANDVVLLTYDSPVPSNLLAGLVGTLKVVNGCIRVENADGGSTVVFPSSFSYRIVEGKLELIYRGEVYAREGDRVGWGGFPDIPEAPKILGDVSRCPGPYFFR